MMKDESAVQNRSIAPPRVAVAAATAATPAAAAHRWSRTTKEVRENTREKGGERFADGDR